MVLTFLIAIIDGDPKRLLYATDSNGNFILLVFDPQSGFLR